MDEKRHVFESPAITRDLDRRRCITSPSACGPPAVFEPGRIPWVARNARTRTAWPRWCSAARRAPCTTSVTTAGGPSPCPRRHRRPRPRRPALA